MRQLDWQSGATDYKLADGVQDGGWRQTNIVCGVVGLHHRAVVVRRTESGAVT